MAEGCPSHTSLCPTPLHGPSSIKPCLFPYTVLLRALFDWDIRVPSTLILQSFAPARRGFVFAPLIPSAGPGCGKMKPASKDTRHFL